MGVVKLVVGIFGNITAMLLFLSPMPTFWDIIRKKTTGSYSGIPYVCSLSNCLLWTFYGLPIITKGNMLVLTINGSGCVLESAYLITYLIYAHRRLKGQMSLMIVGVLVFSTIVVIVTLTAIAKGERKTIVGSIALVLNVAMYASPLSVMKEVIKTQSVESMPFLLSLWTFINSCLWAAYGIYQRDKFIIIPNVLGAIFGMVQLALYAYYRNGRQQQTQGLPDSNLDPGYSTIVTSSTVDVNGKADAS